MPEEVIVRQCAPTLAGIKTGSLFPYRCADGESLMEDIRAVNKKLVPKGLCLLLMRRTEQGGLLYLFRPENLKRDLQNGKAQCVLRAAGYDCENSGRCIARLVRKLRENGEFPHEIGLFLSYPPEDVQGFIENHAKNFKCAGLWKVYGDEGLARSLFAAFKKCTAVYCKRWQEGSCLEELAVTVRQN